MSSAGVAAHMAHAHGPYLRTQTAPAYTNSSGICNVPPGLSQTMTQTISHSSHPSIAPDMNSHASSSTISLSSMTSSTTLVASNPMSQNGGQVVATNNIINQRADASRSLYQICVNLRHRLAKVPELNEHLNDSEDENEEETDPVSSLWRYLRNGTPLLTIYNSLQPLEPLKLDEKMPVAKRPKIAAFKFVEACLKGDLHIPPGDCFSLQDLFGDDTTGFVKVGNIYLWIIQHVSALSRF